MDFIISYEKKKTTKSYARDEEKQTTTTTKYDEVSEIQTPKKIPGYMKLHLLKYSTF